jgi:hypothetical protein
MRGVLLIGPFGAVQEAYHEYFIISGGRASLGNGNGNEKCQLKKKKKTLGTSGSTSGGNKKRLGTLDDVAWAPCSSVHSTRMENGWPGNQ